jgi:hypothetical protein
MEHLLAGAFGDLTVLDISEVGGQPPQARCSAGGVADPSWAAHHFGR